MRVAFEAVLLLNFFDVRVYPRREGADVLVSETGRNRPKKSIAKSNVELSVLQREAVESMCRFSVSESSLTDSPRRGGVTPSGQNVGHAFLRQHLAAPAPVSFDDLLLGS